MCVCMRVCARVPVCECVCVCARVSLCVRFIYFHSTSRAVRRLHTCQRRSVLLRPRLTGCRGRKLSGCGGASMCSCAHGGGGRPGGGPSGESNSGRQRRREAEGLTRGRTRLFFFFFACLSSPARDVRVPRGAAPLPSSRGRAEAGASATRGG